MPYGKVIIVNGDDTPIDLKEKSNGLKLLRKIKQASLLFSVLLLAGLGVVIAGVGALLIRNQFVPGKQLAQDISKRDVLAASVSQLDLIDKIQFDLPALFNDTATFNSDIVFKGKKIDLGSSVLTGGNIVTGIATGNGITTTGGQTPTITNTGVLSLQSQTGTVTLTAGSGITISGTTISNSGIISLTAGSGISISGSTITNSSQGGNAFGIVTVGGSNITAGSTNDTITFVAGNGVTLTPDTSNKKLTINNTSSTGLTTNGVLYANSSTGFVSLTPGTSGYVLQSNGTGTAPSWVSVTGGGINFWQLNSGVLSPVTISNDLAIGGTATSSALFQVYGLTGNATTSGTLTFNTTGTIQTTKNQTLTLGGNSTGNIILNPLNGSGNVGVGTTNPIAPFQVGTNTSTSAPKFVYSSEFSLSNGVANYVGAWRSSGYWGLGTATGTFGDTTLRLGNVNNNNFSTGAVWTNSQTVNLVMGGNIGVGQGSNNTLLAALDARATSGTLPIASLSGSTSFAGLVVDNSGVGDLFTASSSGLNRFVITQNGNVGIGTTTPTRLLDIVGNITHSSVGTASQLSLRGTADSTQKLNIGYDTTSNYGFIEAAQENVQWQNLALQQGGGNIGIGGTDFSGFKLDLNGDIGVCGGCNDTWSLGSTTREWKNVYGKFGNFNAGLQVGTNTLTVGTGTTPIASLSGQTSFAGLVVDNSGVGDLITASSSGKTRFVITQNGNEGVGTMTPAYTLDIAGKTAAFNSGQDGSLGSWSTNANALPVAQDRHGSVVANGYVYVIGGYNGSSLSTVYYAKLNSDGSTGTWSTNANALPAVRDTFGFAVSNGYLYVIGGQITNGTVQSTVYYAKLNSDGSTGAWLTNVNALPAARKEFTALVANGYIYVIGGTDGTTTQSTVYYAKLNSDGSTGTWSTNANALPAVRDGYGSVVANGYIYVMGGEITAGTVQSTVYYAKLNSDGSTGTWSTNANALPAVRDTFGSIVANGYVYVIGGYDGSSAQSTVYYAKLNSDGSTGAWSTNANALPAIRQFLSTVVTNGYVYAIGGAAASVQSTVYYASTARVLIAGNLDLIGLTSSALASASGSIGGMGGTGGSIFAGNIFSNGNLEVTGNTQLFGSAGIVGNLSLQGQVNIASSIGTIATASVSGATSMASMVVDQSGVGDIFTASSSGLNRFVVTQNGNVGIGTAIPSSLLDVEGGNITIGQQTNTGAAAETTWSKVTQSTAGTIASNDSSAIASISATAVYNGSLYVGTYGTATGSAEIYRYNSGNGTGTSWTKVSQPTPGTIASGGTTAIASVSAMIVYNGYLYAGTTKTGQAQVYRYNGGTSWTVINTTAGTFDSFSNSAHDGVSAMTVYNGELWIGTAKIGAARIYRYLGGTGASPFATQGASLGTIDKVTAMISYDGSLFLGSSTNDGQATLWRYGSISTMINVSTSTTFCGSAAVGVFCIIGSGTNDTSVTAITSMVVYNGRLYLGLRKLGGGGDLVYLDQSGATQGNSNPSNLFMRAISAAGTVVSGGTSSIDGISSLAVYNGKLYAGTEKSGAAELYRYEGGIQDPSNSVDGTKWTKISNATAGTIATGGTGSINMISAMIPYNGNLYAGTYLPAGAEIYSYNVVSDQSYALQFHAGASEASGEQNSLLNMGSISFVATESANTNNGYGTGAFVFSHGITTSFGAYDVAEDYGTRDDSLQPGDIVAMDTNEGQLVKKANSGDSVIGIYSEHPGFRLSQSDGTINGGRAIPVALAGRVPVKVATESGNIRIGDLLTISSSPGVAMKATKAEFVVGRAMESYNGNGIGTIMAFVNISWADPGIAITSSGDLNIGQAGSNNTNVPLNTNAAVASAIIPSNGQNNQNQTGTNTATGSGSLTDMNKAILNLQEEVASMSGQIVKLSAKDDLAKRVDSLEKQLNLLTSITSTGSGLLSQEDATVSGNLSVIGKTLLTEVGITGRITSGVLTIDGMGTDSATPSASINTLSGPLKLQSQGLNGLDILNGKVIVDTNGNLVSSADIYAKNVKADKFTVTGDSAGKAVIAAGKTEIEVTTSALTDKSLIFVTPEDNPVGISAKKSGTNKFIIKIQNAQSQDLTAAWWLVN